MLGTRAQTIRFPITPAASLVVNDLYFPLALAPAAFWAVVRTDGGDIRVTAQDGVTRCACDVVDFDYANRSGSLFFQGNSASAFYVVAGDGSVAPAADAAYGKYSVWESDLKVMLHESDNSDSTVNQNTQSSANLTQSSGKLGLCNSWNGSSSDGHVANSASMNVLDYSYAMWIKPAVLAQNTKVLIGSCRSGTFGQCLAYTDSSNKFQFRVDRAASVGTALVSIGSYSTDWKMVVFTLQRGESTAEQKIYLDGSLDNSKTISLDIAAFSPSHATTFGNLASALGVYGNNVFSGLIDEIRLYGRALSADEIAQMFANQNDPAAFWTVGAAG